MSPACVLADTFSASVDKVSGIAQTSPVVVEADKLEGQKENQIEASGNVVLRNDGQSIRADRMLYNQESQDFDASGSVVLEQGDSTISGPQLMLNLGTEAGTMHQPEFFLGENRGRGGADIIRIQDRQHYSLDNARYTTCRADDEDWVLKTRGLELDRERQVGVAHHTWVEFMGVPILYSPWMDFPLNDQAKSGFLAPLFGSTTKGGSELTLPYYWSIAPNFDATIAPRFMNKRGVMLNNEFRYLQESYRGELHFDVLPDDRLAKRSRDRVALTHIQNFGRGFRGYLDYNHVSDDDYFRDLSASLNSTSQVNLLQEAGVGYAGDGWSANLRAQRYQTLQDPVVRIAEPHARLPQLTVSAQKVRAGASWAFTGEFVDFYHPTALNASRLVMNPSVSYPLITRSALYVTPKIALHSTRYTMGSNNVGALQNTSRTVPMLSVDSGATFEREVSLFGGHYVNTLEPRAFYVYVPYRDQSALPNFDSAQADFSFTQIFTENRFFGNDRIGDANQITLAMSSRFLDRDSGAEHLRVMLGQRFSFEAPRVNLAPPTISTNRSDILMAVSGRVTDAWWLDGEAQFDPNQSRIQRYNVASSFRPEAGKVLNLGYRFRRNTLRQVDVSGQWPLSNRWQAVGRWNYSLQDRRIFEAVAGLEYNQDCWKIRLVAQRLTTATQQTNTGIFIQLELNDLVRVGSDPLGLLKQSVPGYQINK
ncbi:MAG: LPS-assembly protein LptD [Pseudomonadota bacterium]